MNSAPIAAPIGAAPATSLPPASPEGAPVDAIGGPTDPAADLSATHLKGANWFFWIVGLSLINTALIAFGSDITLALGTSATLIIDSLTKEGELGRISEFVLDALIIGFYAFCGLMAVRGKTWAFYLGMGVFALDMILTIVLQQIVGTLIHAWALFTMFQGLTALKHLHALRKAEQAPETPWSA